MTDAVDAAGMTLNETIDAIGWSKGDRVQPAGTFNGYEIYDRNEQLIGTFTASGLWAHLRRIGEIR